MKDSEIDTPQQLDEGWDDIEPLRASNPPSASVNEVQLAAVDDGWEADEQLASSDSALDEGWEPGEGESSNGSSGASAARTGDAARKAGARTRQRRAAQPPVVDAAHRALSKKERRALERKQRTHASQRNAQRKQEEKTDREQRRRVEQQALAEQKAAEQEAARARAAAQKIEQRRAAEARAAEQKRARKQAAVEKTPRGERPLGSDTGKLTRREKSNEASARGQRAKFGFIRAPWVFAVVILALAILLAWLRQ